MTQDELDAIKARVSVYFPWRVAVDDECGDNWLVASLGADICDGKEYYVTTDHVHASEYDACACVDAVAIAQDHKDVPALVAEVERLRAALTEIERTPLTYETVDFDAMCTRMGALAYKALQ